MQEENGVFEILFEVNKINPLILYGVGDKNLRLIEKNFDVQLIARGNQLKVRGAQREEVEQVENILSEIVFTANRNKHLSIEDVETIIHINKAEFSSATALSDENRFAASDELDEVVLFTKTGYIKARTKGQQKIVGTVKRNDLVIVVGPAGTGKTYMAVALAVGALKEKRVKKIVLARPAVEAGESLGFLPGDFKEKIDPYLRPLYDSLEDMLPRDLIKKYLEQGIIEVIPLAYMRGRTLNNAFVILDEAQNATATQMKMFLTRLGANSKAIVNGDDTQIDLPGNQRSGLTEIQIVLKNVDGIEFIYLEKADVVRHKLVRDIIQAYGEFNNKASDDVTQQPEK